MPRTIDLETALMPTKELEAHYDLLAILTFSSGLLLRFITKYSLNDGINETDADTVKEQKTIQKNVKSYSWSTGILAVSWFFYQSYQTMSLKEGVTGALWGGLFAFTGAVAYDVGAKCGDTAKSGIMAGISSIRKGLGF